MKAIILFGSPRKEGNTILPVRAFAETLKKRGCDVRTIYLNDLNIRPCQGCLACVPEGICKINDDMKDIRKYIIESDLIVYASPVYWFAPSSQLKVVIDRSMPFLDTEYNSRIKGKKAVTIMTCASEDDDAFSASRDMFGKIFQLLGMTCAGSIEATGCIEKGSVKDEYKKKAEQLAESLL